MFIRFWLLSDFAFLKYIYQTIISQNSQARHYYSLLIELLMVSLTKTRVNYKPVENKIELAQLI